MFYSFDEHEATEYGVNEAILLDFFRRDALTEIAHTKSKQSPHKVYFNRFWEEFFPFWEREEVVKILSSLEDKGCINMVDDNLGGQDCLIITLSAKFLFLRM